MQAGDPLTLLHRTKLHRTESNKNRCHSRSSGFSPACLRSCCTGPKPTRICSITSPKTQGLKQLSLTLVGVQPRLLEELLRRARPPLSLLLGLACGGIGRGMKQ